MGKRVFSISESGGARRELVDPFAPARGEAKAATPTLPAKKYGTLALRFAAQVGKALVSAIDVVPINNVGGKR